jgi:hypothetical protein
MLSGNLWSKHGHFSKALSKGPNTTTWIWNLHADAHDFDIQDGFTRKVFASSLAHLSLVFLSIGGIHLHTAYFSSFYQWLKDPLHVQASAHIVYQILNQDILNSDIGCNFQGIIITSGISHPTFLRSYNQISAPSYSLRFNYLFHSLHTWILFQNAYFSLIIIPTTTITSSTRCFKLCCTSNISNPINTLLDSGIDPEYIPHILFLSPQSQLFNPITNSINLSFISSHHLYLAIGLVILNHFQLP